MFKSFNANKIDASSVTTSAHVDAPEISADKDVATQLGGLGLGGAEKETGDDQWADSQGGGWGSNNNGAAATGPSGDSKVAELLDMNALKAKRNEQDDVAERLRIEETKAKLAKAKEGMAKEAERLKEEKANKGFKAVGPTRGPAAMGLGAAMGGGGAGGKWVPSHMRSTGAGGASRFGMGSATRGPASMEASSGAGGGFQKPVDMANEELFPDLASADKILADKEEQEKQEQARMASSQARAPTGWGARPSMGAGAAAPAARKPLNLAPAPVERKPLNLASAKKTEEEAEPKKEEKKEEEPKPAAEAAPAESPAAAPAAAAPAEKKEKKVLKKKKKKDLSTFKPKS